MNDRNPQEEGWEPFHWERPTRCDGCEQPFQDGYLHPLEGGVCCPPCLFRLYHPATKISVKRRRKSPLNR
jgi:recombinational DNA repair protein (RecF pathway)